MLYLGKLPAKIDKRTIRLSSILKPKKLPELPPAYDLDYVLGVDDNFMYANDEFGCCVISARAHQTLRFEAFETGTQPFISDNEVVSQYLKESGGEDKGLYLLDSLKSWRNEGWKVGDKTYNIYAFASVNWRNHTEVKHCIHLLGGLNFGMMVYQRDMEQFDTGQDWELRAYSGMPLGGHAVYSYAYGYNDDGLMCMTWGKRQRMSWDFFDVRLDECFGIVDNRNDWLEDSPIDVKLLDSYLQQVTCDVEPSTCAFAQGGCKVLNYGAERLSRKSRFKAVCEVK